MVPKTSQPKRGEERRRVREERRRVREPCCPTLLKSPATQHFLFLTWLRSYSAPPTSLFLAYFVYLSSFLLYPFRLVDAPELPSRLGLLSVDRTLRSFVSRTHKRTNCLCLVWCLPCRTLSPSSSIFSFSASTLQILLWA